MVEITEELDTNLQEVHKTLDDYCQQNGMNYSVDCDEASEQGYLVSKSKKMIQLIDHMRQQVEALKDQVVMTINPQPSTPLNVGPLPAVRKDGTLLHFAVKPIQDSVIPSEDQIKSPTTKHIRDQAPFRSSFGKSKSFGNITHASYTESKKMLGNIDPFDERLGRSLNEHVEIQFAQPDVLLTHVQRTDDVPVNKNEIVKNAIAVESKRFEQYIDMINNTDDDEVLAVLETLSEDSNANIKKLEALLTPNEGGPASSNQGKN